MYQAKKLVETVTGILFVRQKFKHMSCIEFHTYHISQPNLLKAVSSWGKYNYTHGLRLLSPRRNLTILIIMTQNEVGQARMKWRCRGAGAPPVKN